jgi:anti-sigma B factor antagonist
MTIRLRKVSVKQLPETLDAKQCSGFLREMETSMSTHRPCVVLDCSRVRQMGSTATHLLLCCLEEAMKRNGDVRLAAVQPNAKMMLELTGVDRLFEMFDTNQDAINSFHPGASFMGLQIPAPAGSLEAMENAA